MLNTCFTIASMLLSSLFICSGQTPVVTPGEGDVTAPSRPDSAQSITYHVIAVTDGQFGYDVYVGGKLLIHQATIPAVTGTSGFSRRQDADAVARLVVSKLKAGQMPPTISRRELEAIGWRGY